MVTFCLGLVLTKPYSTCIIVWSFHLRFNWDVRNVVVFWRRGDKFKNWVKILCNKEEPKRTRVFEDKEQYFSLFWSLGA